MKVGLYGINGVYNFGCEAIVRGAYNFISKVYPGSKIIYYSYALDYDEKILWDLDIEVREVTYTKNVVKKIANRLFPLIDPNYQLLMIDYKKIFSEVDVIFSIGGDIYSIPEVLRKKKEYKYYNSLVNFCNKAINKGKLLIVYGASVGPWGNYQKAIDYYSDNMKRYNSILCRESSSVEYLKMLNFDNMMFFPDPAFQVKCNNNTVSEKQFIGINFSPLAFNEVYGTHDEEIVDNVANLMDQLYNTYHLDILFIPHVISKDEKDDDFRFLNKIMGKMLQKSHAYMANYRDGFLGVKRQIRNCYVVASARMHCSINATVECVPTLFIAYSQKSKGICEYIYGNQENVISIQDVEKSLIKKVGFLLDNEKKINSFLRQRNEEINNYYEENINSMSLSLFQKEH